MLFWPTQGFNKFFNMCRRMKGIKETVWNGIIPLYRNCDKGGMHVFPAGKRKQYLFRFCTFVKDGDIIKICRIFYMYLMLFQGAPYGVVCLGITFGNHEQCFPAEVGRHQPLLAGETVRT